MTDDLEALLGTGFMNTISQHQPKNEIIVKKDVGKNIIKRPLTSSGFSLENTNRLKKVLKNQKRRGKCCGR